MLLIAPFAPPGGGYRLRVAAVESGRIIGAIAKAIIPYIGEMMANSSIEAHCRNIGIPGPIAPRQLDDLLRRLGLGLNIFIGRDKTATVMAQIRSGVELPS